jgi:hypothetical protein
LYAVAIRGDLEAAIGIEPMNKGFAEIQKDSSPKLMDG